jgi:hypothetical protein
MSDKPTVMRRLKIAEISAVDRPAQAHARVALMKRHDPMIDEFIKREFSDDKRKELAESGAALPDGCLSGDTLVETLDGQRPISGLLGRQRLLTEQGWKSAEVQYFGEQRLAEVRLSRGYVRRSILATLGHRWHTRRGIVPTAGLRPGDLLPQVSRDRFAVAVEPSEMAVAGATEQSANLASQMVMVDMERGPRAPCPRVCTVQRGRPAANGASAALRDKHRLEFGVSDAVFSAQGTFSATKPAKIAEVDLGGRFLGMSSLAGLTFGAPPAAFPNVELARWLPDSAESAVPPCRIVRKRSSQDASRICGTMSPQALVMGAAESDCLDDSYAALDFAGVDGGWSVEEVRMTGLIESVYCGVVPDLHRFALADGLITGNSFPIENEEDLHNAIRAVGRAKDEAKAKAHIIARAKSMGATGALPEDWKASKAVHLTPLKGTTMTPSELRKSLGLADSASDTEVTNALIVKANKADDDAEKAKAKEEEAEKRAKKAEGLAKMSDKHRGFMNHADAKMPTGGKDAFAEMEPSERDAHMKANPIEDDGDADDVSKAIKAGTAFVAAGGILIRKSKVGADVFSVLKATTEQNATLAEQVKKSDEAAALAKFEKQADAEFAHLPGTSAERAELLKAIDAMPEAVKKATLANMAIQEKLAKSAFTMIGRDASDLGLEKKDEDNAEAELDKKAREIVGKSAGTSYAKAYDQVCKDNPDLYAKYVSQKRQRTNGADAD